MTSPRPTLAERWEPKTRKALTTEQVERRRHQLKEINQRRRMDLTGKRFGRLLVVARIEDGGGSTRFVCRCACGVEKPFYASNLKRGLSQSCGCRKSEASRIAATRHGQSHSRAHNTWLGMRRRCGSPSSEDWPNYGGRSIRVCVEWETSFERFLADMGQPPSGTSIERLDVNGNYEPSNCCWATVKEQSRNRRTTRWLTAGGRTLCVADWCRETGIPSSTLHNRLDLLGWPIERALGLEQR